MSIFLSLPFRQGHKSVTSFARTRNKTIYLTDSIWQIQLWCPRSKWNMGEILALLVFCIMCICIITLELSCSLDQATNSETIFFIFSLFNLNQFYKSCWIIVVFITLVQKFVEIQALQFQNWLLDPVSKIHINE